MNNKELFIVLLLFVYAEGYLSVLCIGFHDHWHFVYKLIHIVIFLRKYAPIQKEHFDFVCIYYH
jgi:hypothetical protein